MHLYLFDQNKYRERDREREGERKNEKKTREMVNQ